MVDFEHMSEAGRAAARRYAQRQKSVGNQGLADFRPEGEDDDGYDPYSDFTDAQSRSMHEEPSEDPWR